MTDMKPKFDIEKLNLHYGSFHALKDINMQISAHEITAFIGPSGCGKSTFLKTLNRMNDLVENVKIDGKVELDGQNIFKDMDAITLRHKVGMVFQQPNPFPKSIYDNVAYGPRIFGITKKSDLDEIVERSLKQAAIWQLSPTSKAPRIFAPAPMRTLFPMVGWRFPFFVPTPPNVTPW